MARNEAERYASVADFAADLRRFLAHEPVTAGPPSTYYLLRKFVRRHRVPVAAAALVVLSLVLGTVVSTKLYHDARASAAEAQQHLEDFWRLADMLDLEELETTEKELWPTSPARLEEHERWLSRAERLLERRPLHEQAIASLEASLAGEASAMSAEQRLGAQFLVQRLKNHVDNLRALAAEDGALHRMQQRTAFARTVHQRTIEDRQHDWDRAIAAVDASHRYGSWHLQPTLGLVPLGPDPDSGLEEFAHLQSGRVPVRDAAGHLEIGDDTAIVLVLVPGGDVAIGSQSTDPDAPHHDPFRQPIEDECETVHGDSFLIGKYELTQGQVQALGEQVQALGRPGSSNFGDETYTAR
ncbi:MAG TPA: hypothetical protein VFZ65_16265, partial [Planctomycetota bacterium]|nr:hypothetical protein [Planctomycetota bacterium]